MTWLRNNRLDLEFKFSHLFCEKSIGTVLEKAFVPAKYITESFKIV